MGYIDFSDYVRRLRRNIFAVAAVALFLEIFKIPVTGIPGLITEGVTPMAVRVALFVILVAEAVSFVQMPGSPK